MREGASTIWTGIDIGHKRRRTDVRRDCFRRCNPPEIPSSTSVVGVVSIEARLRLLRCKSCDLIDRATQLFGKAYLGRVGLAVRCQFAPCLHIGAVVAAADRG